MPRIRLAPVAAGLAATTIALGAAPGAAQGPYPACDPAATAPVTFGNAGFPEAEDGDPRLFATHPITVAAGIPFTHGDQLTSDLMFDPPGPGLARVTDDEVGADAGLGDYDGLTDFSTVLGESPGTFPSRVSWTQFDENGRNPCSASATTAVTLLAPTAKVRLGKPKDTGGTGGDEAFVTMKIPLRGGDLRPLELRYRAVRVRRFPGTGAKRRTIALPMRVTDAGFKRNRSVAVKVGGLKALFEPETGEALLQRFSVRFEIRAAPRTTNYGYDIDVHQGGRRVTRLRVAGSCHRIAGLVLCHRSKVKLTP